jgi:hypothetical protein
MRDNLPFILVGLAIFCAGCVAYVAWELTKEAMRDGDITNDAADADADADNN